MLAFNPGAAPFPLYQPFQGLNFGTIAPPTQMGFGAVGGAAQMAQVAQILQQLLQGLSQLAGAWSGMLGGFQQGGFPQGGSQGAYGGTSGLIGNVAAPPAPGDPNEFASYLQAQVRGGALEGKTGIAQRDAIPGTRFGQVQDSQAWQSSLARNYAYQFAAYAVGADPLSPPGMQKGQQAFNSMSDDARLFMQVASIFKGNMLNGPGFYNNPGLKELLLSRGLTDLANQPGVGQTDVQSIGAITTALNRGQLRLDDVINSGTIDNLDRYGQVIQFVKSGAFNQALDFYDNVPL